MRIKTVVAQYKVLSRLLFGRTEEGHDKSDDSRLRTEIWSRDLPDTKQEC